MRLIDADALIEDIREHSASYFADDFAHEWVDQQPTIEPPPHYDEWCDGCKEYDQERHSCPRWNKVIRKTLKDVGKERKTDIIQNFHDYQIDWLKSHYDIELEPQLEEMIVRFLHDTANCYMMNGGEQE